VRAADGAVLLLEGALGPARRVAAVEGAADLAAVPGGAVVVAGAALHLVLGDALATSVALPHAASAVLVDADAVLALGPAGVTRVARAALAPAPALAAAAAAAPGLEWPTSSPLDWTDPWDPSLGTTPGTYCWRTGTHWTFDGDVRSGSAQVSALAASIGTPREDSEGFLWAGEAAPTLVKNELDETVADLGAAVTALAAARGAGARVAWATAAGAVGVLDADSGTSQQVLDLAAAGLGAVVSGGGGLRATYAHVYACTSTGSMVHVAKVDHDGALASWSAARATGALLLDRGSSAVRLALPSGDDELFSDAEMPGLPARMWVPEPGQVAWLPYGEAGLLLQVSPGAAAPATSPAARESGASAVLSEPGGRVLAQLPGGVAARVSVRYPKRGGAGGAFVVGGSAAAASDGVLVLGDASVERLYVGGRPYNLPWTLAPGGTVALAPAGAAVHDPDWDGADRDVPRCADVTLETRGAVVASGYEAPRGAPVGAAMSPELGLPLMRLLRPRSAARPGPLGGRTAGVPAQELEEAVEALVPGASSRFVYTDRYGYKSVNYGSLAAAAALAGQQLRLRCGL